MEGGGHECCFEEDEAGDFPKLMVIRGLRSS